ncbi:Ig-like domain-containing protein [Niallia sp. FSL M8-0099]|uniref:Ig-like domain-containing protein n=1 Tax=Niallia sp. FSL M8-0099 TaxID=2954519 RepID=UPI0030FC07D9
MRKKVHLFIAIILLLSLFVPYGSNSKIKAASNAISINFQADDAVIDPNRPYIYMVETGKPILHRVNYLTGEIKKINLKYPAEKVEVYKDKVYVTQHLMKHSYYTEKGLKGAIAEVDAGNFTLLDTFPISTDPWDIAIDQNGYLYITPGSNQWETIKVYSLNSKKEVAEDAGNDNTSIYMESSISYNEKLHRLYTLDSAISPIDAYAYLIDNGKIVDHYDSPYHGDYHLSSEMVISPDGQYMYNMNGVVFRLSTVQEEDMTFDFEFRMANDEENNEYETFNDIAFDDSGRRTYIASSFGGIDVYGYGSADYYYSLKEDYFVHSLFYQNGLIAIYEDENGNNYVEYMKNTEPSSFELTDSLFYDVKNDEWASLRQDSSNLEIDSELLFFFNQGIRWKDRNGITLMEGDKKIPIQIESDDNYLHILPELLTKGKKYKLTINKNAITGYAGKSLDRDIVITFGTIVEPVSEVFLEKDSSQAPKMYTFIGGTTGGSNPLYEFYIKEGNNWKKIQSYSRNNKLEWQPAGTGTFQFKVYAKSSGSRNLYDSVREFSQKVTDTIKPSITITQKTKKPTNRDIELQITAKDNLGIRYIQLPDGKKVNNENVKYMVKKNGTYTFTVVDLGGNKQVKSITIKNLDKTPPKEPQIKEVTDKSTTVSGKGEVNAKVVVLAGKKELGKSTVQKDGRFQIKISKQKAGTKLVIKIIDAAGNSTSKAIKVIDKTPPAKPKITTNVTSKTTLIAGKAEANATITIYNGKKFVQKTTADGKGSFKMTIKKQKKNTSLLIYAQDKAKNKSQATKIKVK